MCDSGFGYSKANAAEKEKQIKSKAKKKKSDKSLRPLKVAGFDSHFSQSFQMILFFFQNTRRKRKIQHYLHCFSSATQTVKASAETPPHSV